MCNNLQKLLLSCCKGFIYPADVHAPSMFLNQSVHSFRDVYNEKIRLFKLHLVAGHLTCLDPYTVQLNFEPSGRPGAEDSYYLNFKNNICVVCGSDHSYMRKNIVPHDYRRYFPLVMKDHHSHDIVLMCPDCHCLSNYHDDRLRKELATNYDAPLGKHTIDVMLIHALFLRSFIFG